MEQVYLINKSTFTGFEDLAVNIEEIRLKVFIKKAQDLDLSPFLNAVFFYDLIKSVVFNEDGTLKTGDEGTPQKYVDLLNGKEYQDRAGNKLYFDGLIPALVYWTFARFIEADSFRYTATGVVIKDHDEATALKQSEIAKLVSQQRSVANAHANNVVMFLDANKGIYTLWQYNRRNEASRQPGPRMRGVDATVVRSGGYSYRNGFFDGLI